MVHHVCSPSCPPIELIKCRKFWYLKNGAIPGEHVHLGDLTTWLQKHFVSSGIQHNPTTMAVITEVITVIQQSCSVSGTEAHRYFYRCRGQLGRSTPLVMVGALGAIRVLVINHHMCWSLNCSRLKTGVIIKCKIY